jgi:hypothetical protein
MTLKAGTRLFNFSRHEFFLADLLERTYTSRLRFPARRPEFAMLPLIEAAVWFSRKLVYSSLARCNL